MKIINIGNNYLTNVLIVSLIFLLDRISKLYVIHLDEKNLNKEIFSSKFLNFHLIWNDGIAFGLLSFNQNSLYNLISFLIFLIIIIIFFMILKSERFKKYSLLMILGGALGNFFDRIFYKSVPDFIDLHIGNFHWFIFNIADVFITLGVIFMIFLEFTDMNYKKKNS